MRTCGSLLLLTALAASAADGIAGKWSGIMSVSMLGTAPGESGTTARVSKATGCGSKFGEILPFSSKEQ
jgi:hypothetical protein